MSSASPSSRLAVVTGGTSGIGLEIVRGLAARGCHVVLVGRGAVRVTAVAESVRASTGNVQVDGVPVSDLAVRSEWQSLARTLLERYPAIHVLVNNAGAYFARREVTTDGIERTFALNVLAPLGLTTLLGERLKSTAPSRVVNIASTAHRGQHVELDDLEGSATYRGFRAYGRSKLELILLSRELARRFEGSGVTVNSVHPGFIRSGFGRNNGGGIAFGFRLAERLFGRSVRYGAATPLRVAWDDDLATVTGAYFERGRIARGSAQSRDMIVAGRLYEACRPYLSVPG